MPDNRINFFKFILSLNIMASLIENSKRDFSPCKFSFFKFEYICCIIFLVLCFSYEGTTQCTVPATDILQPGYAIYACRAYLPGQPVLAVRNVRPLPLRYQDPANLACNHVDNAPYAPSIKTWSDTDFGGNSVMGIAFDHRTGEIYAATSYLYNNFYGSYIPFEETVVAEVYRISADGNTVQKFATLPGNKGTGWLDIDTLHNLLYVTNLDDGQIYSIPLSGGTNQTGPYVTYTPFTADMLNESTPPTAPDWNMAPLGERILGVGFNPVESRLYYSVWVTDHIGNATNQNIIRSVQISPSGAFVSGTDVLEATLPYLTYINLNGLPFSMPVTDIVFSADGSRMLLAEQGFDSSVGSGGDAHNSRLLEYTGSTSSWVAEPINKFDIGRFSHDTRGGVSFSPGGYSTSGNTILNEDYVMATADAVGDYYLFPPGGPPFGVIAFYIDGAGFMPSSGSYSNCNMLALDLDQANYDPNKSSFGDVDIRVCPYILPQYDLALQKKLNTAVNPGPYQVGDQVTFKLTIYNQGTETVTNIRVNDIFPPQLTLNDADWVSLSSSTAQYTLPTLPPSGMVTVDITFTINSGTGELKNYAEIAGFNDQSGTPVSDFDSNTFLSAGNDPYEVDDEIYGTEANEDHDDLDFATVWLGTVGIGNVVFVENNSDKVFNAGEGINGITVELYRPGYGPDGISGNADDADMVMNTITSNGGEYFFTGLRPGNYIVTIPYSMFGIGSPLFNFSSIAGDGSDNQTDDNLDENSRDVNNINVMPYDRAGVNSVLIGLYPGTEPVGEAGFNGSNDTPDENIDYTVDFGFFKSVGLGNLVWMDFNDNNQFDVGEGVANASLNLYRFGYGPDGIAGNTDDNDVVATTVTDGNGVYSFLGLPQGDYVVKMPVFQFNTLGIGLLYKARNILGNDSDTGIDDNISENTIDALEPFYNGASSDTIHLKYGTEPINEAGFQGNIDFPDEDIDFTVDFGFKPLVGIGNLVWIDSDNNNIYTLGEGINGVTVELYKPGFGPDNIPGNSDDNQVVQTSVTFTGGSGDGAYVFGDYPGTYVVKIPASQFQVGGPLYGYVSISGSGGDNQVDDNADENGVDIGIPAVNGISSAPIPLSVNGEIINEPGYNFFTGPFDGNIDFTIDFGFQLYTCVTPTATVAVTQPKCTGTGAPNNGTLTIIGFTSGQRYQYSPGITFNSGSAVPSAITLIPPGGVITSTLPNTTQTYTVKIYDAIDDACFNDTNVTITQVSCCPTNNCFPTQVVKN
jgi:uncharacterized repeat protein (TIGR01451 family)